MEEDEKSKNRICEGRLVCKKCNATFEIIDEIVCLKPISKRDKVKARAQKTKQYLLNQRKCEREWLSYLTEQEASAIKNEWDWMVNILKLKKGKIHLDWATGGGKLLRNVFEVAKGEIITLEIDYPTCVGLKTYLKSIGKCHNVTIIYGDAVNMPFFSNSIDSISSWGGLNEPNIKRAIDESKRVLKKGRVLALSGEFYERRSKSLEKALKAGIKFAKENKAYQYFKKLDFKDISYKTFFKAKKMDRKDFLPCFGDYYTSYVISGRK